MLNCSSIDNWQFRPKIFSGTNCRKNQWYQTCTSVFVSIQSIKSMNKIIYCSFRFFIVLQYSLLLLHFIDDFGLFVNLLLYLRQCQNLLHLYVLILSGGINSFLFDILLVLLVKRLLNSHLDWICLSWLVLVVLIYVSLVLYLIHH